MILNAAVVLRQTQYGGLKFTFLDSWGFFENISFNPRTHTACDMIALFLLSG